MKITKYGHCCLLIKENNLTILTDPGSYSDMQSIVALTGIDVVLITHEHQDHLHIDSLKEILKNNSNARVFSNNSVGKLLEGVGIKHELLTDGQNVTIADVLIEAFGEKHAMIYPDWPIAENTGYFINSKLFYPGDAFTNPGKQVEILALPVTAPWSKISEVIDYAKEINPSIAFGVHDGIAKFPAMFNNMATTFLKDFGVKYVALENGVEQEF